MFGALIPTPGMRMLLIVITAAALSSAIWMAGANHVQAQWDLADAKADAAASGLRAKKSQNTVQIVTRYVDRVVHVRDVGHQNEKEATAHVTPEADAACVVPGGFVRLHDNAAAGNLSTPAGEADASPSGIPLSRVGAVVAINYARGLENIEQVKTLQEYIVENCTPATSKDAAE